MNRRLAAWLIGLMVLGGCGGDAQQPAANATLKARMGAGAATADDHKNVVQSLYVGYFGRPADPAGLDYFSQQYATAQAPTTLVELSQAYNTNPTVKNLIDSFSSSQESRDLYPGSNDDFIEKIYQNLFGRAADGPGRTYWAQGIASGAVTRANAVVGIMAGARGSDVDIINFKTSVASQFSVLAKDMPTEFYSGMEANAMARAMLATITSPKDDAAVTATLTDTARALNARRQSAPNITGNAAMDSPMAGAAVTLRCLSNLQLSATADSAGKFEFSVPTQSFPCLAAARGTGRQTGFVFHSVALKAGDLRITPVTDAVLSIVVHGKLASYDAARIDDLLPRLSTAAIDKGVATLVKLLPPPLKLPAADPFASAVGQQGDPFAAVLHDVRSLLVSEDLDWSDAPDFVIAGQPINQSEPVITELTQAQGLPGDLITILGQNLPTSPRPQITLTDADGVTLTAEVVTATDKSVQFRIPAGVRRGQYQLRANGFAVFTGIFINIPDPARNHPFYTAGKTHDLITSRYMHAADGISAALAGTIITYPSRIRTGDKCSVRINSDGSISRLGAKQEVVVTYAWENISENDAKITTRLYEDPSYQSGFVEIIPQGGSVPAHSFAFAGYRPRPGPLDDNSSFTMCVGIEVDAGFQFFAGPAIKNWRALDGKYTGWIGVYEKGTLFDPLKNGPVFIKGLNRTIDTKQKCTITVSGGKVNFALDEKIQIGSFSISDNFKYEPPMLHSQFDTSSIFLDPLIAPEKNYRLLPAKPYFLSTDPEMVLNLESDNTLALHFGVKNYGRTATWFDYDGILWCFSSGLIRPK